ncbi:MAG: helix-turn-helix transcriptional regulator [Neobacillus sp.]
MGKMVRVNINQLLKEHGISLRELSRLTDIRHAALSELANDKRQNIHFKHLARIAEALGIDDMNRIISFIDTDE